LVSFSLEFKNDERGMPFFAAFPCVFDGGAVDGVFCAFSSRFAGDMKLGANNPNRGALFRELGLDTDFVFGLKQVHSQDVLVVDRDNPPLVAADGMVTGDNNVALTVTVADCLPVFLFDTKSGAFALVHSGWKGTGIASNAVKLMKERFGTVAGNVAAVLGPCIGSCCYKVDEERASAFEKAFGGEAVRKDGGDFFLDLKGANIKLLSDAGVENIAVCNDCTFTDKRLGSFRREGENFTHMMAVIQKRK
jgi:YfiH family protein